MATEIAVGDLSPELIARLDGVPALVSRTIGFRAGRWAHEPEPQGPYP